MWEWVAERAAGATEISAADARAMVPVLGDVVRALHHPAAARVDGRSICAALRRAAVQHGVDVREESVDDVRVLAADVVVIVGGAWTDEIALQLGVTLPVGPLRGQIVHLGVSEHDTAPWPIVQPVFGYYMVPWADGRVAVGATVEDAGSAAEVTAGGVHEVLRETLRVLPGLGRDAARSTRRPAAGECRRHADPRCPPGCSRRLRRHRSRCQRSPARPGVRRARRRRGMRPRTRARPHAVQCRRFATAG